MKKILAFILCTVLICAVPIVASAEGESAEAVGTNTTVVENLPTENESATEGEISASETIPEKTVTEEIVDWVKDHIGDISVAGTLLLTIFYEIRKHRKLNGSIGTLNNNAVQIAEKSTLAVSNVLNDAKDISEVVKGYKDEIASLLGEIRKDAEEKKSLEETIKHVEAFLKTAKFAMVELSNEVAELLVLANIPNSKKDELYARHIKAIHELEAAEEVMSNDGTEA